MLSVLLQVPFGSKTITKPGTVLTLQNEGMPLHGVPSERGKLRVRSEESPDVCVFWIFLHLLLIPVTYTLVRLYVRCCALQIKLDIEFPNELGEEAQQKIREALP